MKVLMLALGLWLGHISAVYASSIDIEVTTNGPEKEFRADGSALIPANEAVFDALKTLSPGNSFVHRCNYKGAKMTLWAYGDSASYVPVVIAYELKNCTIVGKGR